MLHFGNVESRSTFIPNSTPVSTAHCAHPQHTVPTAHCAHSTLCPPTAHCSQHTVLTAHCVICYVWCGLWTRTLLVLEVERLNYRHTTYTLVIGTTLTFRSAGMQDTSKRGLAQVALKIRNLQLKPVNIQFSLTYQASADVGSSRIISQTTRYMSHCSPCSYTLCCTLLCGHGNIELQLPCLQLVRPSHFS